MTVALSVRAYYNRANKSGCVREDDRYVLSQHQNIGNLIRS